MRDNPHEEDRAVETPAVKYPVTVAFYKDIPTAWLFEDGHIEQIHPYQVDSLTEEQIEKLRNVAQSI